MANGSRKKEAGKTLQLREGDRRSTAAKRIKSIEKATLEELRIDEPTHALRVLCRRVAELTFVGEELADQLVTGKPISVELMGRNTDRLQRTMKELRDQATGVRLRENMLKNIAEFADDEDDDDDPPPIIPPLRRAPRASPPRKGFQHVIVDGVQSTELRKCR